MDIPTFVKEMLTLCAKGKSVCILDVLGALEEHGATFDVSYIGGDMGEALTECARQVTTDQLFQIANDMKGQ